MHYFARGLEGVINGRLTGLNMTDMRNQLTLAKNVWLVFFGCNCLYTISYPMGLFGALPQIKNEIDSEKEEPLWSTVPSDDPDFGFQR